MTAAWVIRSGRYGERDDFALQNGVTGGGWQEVPDLTAYSTREQIGELVSSLFPPKNVHGYTGQLFALRTRIKPGDLMVMPLKQPQLIAFGRVTGPYEYRGDEADPNRRHLLPVEWIRTDLPRTAVKQDLLFILGSALSTFAPSKHDAVARLEHLLKHGTDPGQNAKLSPKAPSDDVDEPEDLPDVVDIAATRVATRIQEEFAGHELAALVGELLEAEGFQCTVSPPGADGGIDVIAGRGPIGLEDPRLVVQVKSGGSVDAPVVNQLNGVLGHNGEKGLLVAWGGLTKPARDTLRNLRFRIALWEAADVIDAVQRNHDRLSDRTKAKLKMQQIWVTVD